MLISIVNTCKFFFLWFSELWLEWMGGNQGSFFCSNEDLCVCPPGLIPVCFIPTETSLWPFPRNRGQEDCKWLSLMMRNYHEYIHCTLISRRLTWKFWSLYWQDMCTWFSSGKLYVCNITNIRKTIPYIIPLSVLGPLEGNQYFFSPWCHL